MLRIRTKGQSSLEFVFLLIVLIGALIAIQNYFKRGMQGRWKAAVDVLGDQYDPRLSDTNIRQVMTMQSNTSILTFNDVNGYWATRTDTSDSVERKTGYQGVIAY